MGIFVQNLDGSVCVGSIRTYMKQKLESLYSNVDFDNLYEINLADNRTLIIKKKSNDFRSIYLPLPIKYIKQILPEIQNIHIDGVRVQFTESQLNDLSLTHIDRNSSMIAIHNLNHISDSNISTDSLYLNQKIIKNHLVLPNLNNSNIDCSNIYVSFNQKQFDMMPILYNTFDGCIDDIENKLSPNNHLLFFTINEALFKNIVYLKEWLDSNPNSLIIDACKYQFKIFFTKKIASYYSGQAKPSYGYFSYIYFD